jgi:hypothetical protein
MLQPGQFTIEFYGDGYSVRVPDTTAFDYVKYERNPDPIPMQYTGLKDTKGKDIYEGDVIESPADRGVVEFLNGQFVVRYRDGYQDVGFAPSCDEVIGNVYENPELLEKAAA